MTYHNQVFTPRNCHDFWNDPNLVLHEYYHSVHQWGDGRLTVIGYLREARQARRRGDIHDDSTFEQEAQNFADRMEPKFRNCLLCTPGGDVVPPEPPPIINRCGEGGYKCRPPRVFPWGPF